MNELDKDCHSQCFENIYSALIFSQKKFFEAMNKKQWCFNFKCCSAHLYLLPIIRNIDKMLENVWERVYVMHKSLLYSFYHVLYMPEKIVSLLVLVF